MIYARSGMKGHNVLNWQQTLNKVASKIGLSKPLVTDGIFGANSLKATILAQKYIGVTPDGIVGENTYKAFRAKFPTIATGFIAHDTKPADKTYFNTTALTYAKELIEKAQPPKTTYTPPSKPIFRPPIIPPFSPPPIQPQVQVQKKSSSFAIPLAIAGGLFFMTQAG